MIDSLNDAQRQAVTFPNEHVLVLAGAGSGKTRVLTTRIDWLTQNQIICLYSFLAVIYTNKAALEMLTRIESMLPVDTRGMWVGTFHGLCNRLLRHHYRDAGLPQTFQILDSADQLAAVRRLFKELNYDETLFTPRDLQQFINRCKEDGMRPEVCSALDKRDQFMRSEERRVGKGCESA